MEEHGNILAGFNKEYTGDYFSKADYKSASGNHFATQNGASTKYATAYSNNTGEANGTIVYTVGKTGDNTKEVYTGSSDISWHGDYANVVYMSNPFPVRGGIYTNGAYAGVLGVHNAPGGYNDGFSFRTVLGL